MYWRILSPLGEGKLSGSAGVSASNSLLKSPNAHFGYREREFKQLRIAF